MANIFRGEYPLYLGVFDCSYLKEEQISNLYMYVLA